MKVQLFRVIGSLTSLTEKSQNVRKSALSCEAFASFFVEKVLSVHCDLLATVDTVSELEVPWSSLDSVFNTSVSSPGPMSTGFWVLLGQPHAS